MSSLARKVRRARRPAEAELGGTADELAAHILGRVSGAHIFVGPLVWQPSDGTAARVWYFIVAYGNARGECECCRVDVNDEGDRWALKAALLRPRRVLHDFDDELLMARYAEALWPSDKMRGIRKHIEAERAQWAARKANRDQPTGSG